MIDEHQELAMPNGNAIAAAEQRMHERNILQSDW
jgi:hypothetical protein